MIVPGIDGKGRIQRRGPAPLDDLRTVGLEPETHWYNTRGMSQGSMSSSTTITVLRP